MIVQLPRDDAATRRRRLLDAADEVFSEHGVNAPLELVVERAGLGRAALYRHFPDRTTLMMALLDRAIDAFNAAARELGERPDGLGVLLHDAAEHIAYTAPLVDYWRMIERDDPVIEAFDARALAVFMPFVRRAVDADLCRADVDEEQMLLVMDMLGSCLRGNDALERRRLAHRSADLLMQALGMRPFGGAEARAS